MVLTTAAVLEVGASAAGGAADGLKGLSVALLAVFLLEGLVTIVPVLRAAFGRGRHRQTGAAVVPPPGLPRSTDRIVPSGDGGRSARPAPQAASP
jgi:hypothetical protein